MSKSRNSKAEQLTQLLHDLGNVIPYPWSNLETWIAKSIPVIRRSFPGDLDQFKSLIREPRCAEAPWVQGMPHTDYGPTNEKLAFARQHAIREFLRQLVSITEVESGAVKEADEEQSREKPIEVTLTNGIDIFLSHSSRDAELAKAIADLFRSSLNLSSNRIRCTSVSGYKLDVGADTNEQLRRETIEAKVLVGLITDVSIESAYVLFELGARWGARKFLAPLLGAGRGAEILTGPLAGLNALSCTREDLFQLVSNIAAELGASVEPPNVYSENLDRVIAVSEELAEQRGLAKSHEPALPTKTATLSDFECDYLMQMARPRNAGFFYSGINERTGREAAKYQDAVAHFRELGLVDYHNDGYRYTGSGWSLCDQLWALRILDVLEKDKLHALDDVAHAVELTDGQSELEELERLLGEMVEKELVTFDENIADKLVEITGAGLTHRKHRPLNL